MTSYPWGNFSVPYDSSSFFSGSASTLLFPQFVSVPGLLLPQYTYTQVYQQSLSLTHHLATEKDLFQFQASVDEFLD
ncbi:Uncharacterized protein DAT39_020541 [Clarias magur]|uniref:Uncharacterized protein n=1 Tax=Clarias magur TaxID=1594786 RepID=A0A8J4U5K6_CLAMG|nr:Uncharacterized protein DAT39_020541 [Clarias magur]